MAERPADAGRAERLPALLATAWRTAGDRDAVTRTFTFGNFVEAFGRMTRVAMHAGKRNHHPEWFNVRNRVEATPTAHDAGGLAELDVKPARRMDRLAGEAWPMPGGSRRRSRASAFRGRRRSDAGNHTDTGHAACTVSPPPFSS
ncbi:MAG: 4a-hydroxytetrahydrobiopterin dehydratase [Paracoccaceae bacterium]